MPQYWFRQFKGKVTPNNERNIKLPKYWYRQLRVKGIDFDIGYEHSPEGYILHNIGLCNGDDLTRTLATFNNEKDLEEQIVEALETAEFENYIEEENYIEKT